MVASAQTAALAQTPGYHFPGHADPWTGSYGAALSADGRVLAGFSQGGTPGSPGFLWSEETGRSDFGVADGPSARHTRSAAISGDGSTVVGQSFNTSAFVWRGPGTLNQGLGVVDPFHDRTDARGVSNDGSIVVGSSYRNQSTVGQAYRWTSAGGMQGLGYTVSGHVYSEANAISRDGNVIVGMSQSSGGRTDAFRWTAAGGMQELQPPSGSSLHSAYAYGTNHDGSLTVGMSQTASGALTATVWTASTVQALPTPVGWDSQATDLSDDGSVVLGSFSNNTAVFVPHIWTPVDGWQTPAVYFASQGFPVPEGWSIADVSSVSSDGRTFGGRLRLPGDTLGRAFVLTVPAPTSACALLLVVSAALRRRRQ